jgi:integrase
MDNRQHVTRPARVIVEGPLAPSADGMRKALALRGYAGDTITDHVHLLADLSGWLAGGGLTAADLTSAAAEEFAAGRRGRGFRTGTTLRAVIPVLEYLRSTGAAPPAETRGPRTPQEELLAAYRAYLSGERGVAAGTVAHYLRYARWFLDAMTAGRPDGTLAGLSAADVTGYVLEWAASRNGRPPDRVALPALRSFLRYLHVSGVAGPLAGAVPHGRGFPAPPRPRSATADQVRAVLDACDREYGTGRRDYAVMLTMARLALRGGEVARLELGDIDWRAATVTVRGKGGRTDVLPLPADVGAAIADYLLKGRPPSESRRVFTVAVAPFRGMGASTVTQLVQRACRHAGIPLFGPHGMRHAAAGQLLASGAGMEEIGQLLRHAQERTTAIYARTDPARLSALARPCPEGAAR